MPEDHPLHALSQLLYEWLVREALAREEELRREYRARWSKP